MHNTNEYPKSISELRDFLQDEVGMKTTYETRNDSRAFLQLKSQSVHVLFAREHDTWFITISPAAIECRNTIDKWREMITGEISKTRLSLESQVNFTRNNWSSIEEACESRMIDHTIAEMNRIANEMRARYLSSGSA